MAKNSEYSENVKKNLKTLVDHFDKEDMPVRERQLRLWKKLNLYWCGFTRTWFSEVAHDWRIYDQNYGDNDQGYYDKPINVFRAFLETIIAAMSVTVPPIRCLPDDAENVNDVLTAKGGTKIAELIYKHNDAPLLWCKALFVYCTQGMIAAYNRTVESEKYGTVIKPKMGQVAEEIPTKICPTCTGKLTEATPELEQAINQQLQEQDENDPQTAPAMYCSTCNAEIPNPMEGTETVIVTKQTGVTNNPKSRQCIEVYGGLNVKVANYARCQDETPYLRYSYEKHYALILGEYPDLRNKIDNGSQSSSSGYDLNERWARLSPQFYGEYPTNTPTCNNWWFRKSAFNVITDDDDRKELERLFPNGAKVVFVNDQFACAKDESLDDHWTLSYNPLSEYIHFDPLGLLLTSIQEITDDIISLSLQTIEHGIGQTFADPQVLNFKQYRETESTPGMVFAAKPKGGKSLSDSFFELRTATLSQEVSPFGEKINELGQFVSGALPSLSGGNADNSSKTAAQYSMSRQQAMQRLQTPWKMINFWWKDIFAKVIPAYIQTMQEDERVVKRQGDSFINSVIRHSEMEGKLGDIEIEASESLPITGEQIKDTIMELFGTNNPDILQMLGTPENIPWIAQAIGLNKFFIPGEDDRQKQYDEIKLLINSAPIPQMNQMTGQQEELPSIVPDFDVDNHTVEAEICRSYLVGEAGRQLKIDNEAAYRNILLHMKMHKMMEAQQMAMMAPVDGGNGATPNQQQGQQNA